MERYTNEDLRWLMASYSGLDVYGPSEVFQNTSPHALNALRGLADFRILRP